MSIRNCDHEGAGVTEFGTCAKYLMVVNGRLQGMDFDADTKGVFEIHCPKCGLKKRYSIYSKKCPKWVLRLNESRYGTGGGIKNA